jgi:hypothetical protein
MRVDYTRRETSKPIFSLGNVTHRFLPLLQVQILGPAGRYLFSWAKLDCAADDTVFPSWMAARLDIDLTNAPEHEAHAVGGGKVGYRYAEVELRISDNDSEMFVWPAIVGFGDSIKRPLLGQAGMMQFFDIEFLGNDKQLFIMQNSSFPGRRLERQAP